MMNCKEATEAGIRRSEGRISFKERINLFIHLIACKYCRVFVSQQQQINDWLSKPKLFIPFSDEEKESLENKLKNQ